MTSLKRFTGALSVVLAATFVLGACAAQPATTEGDDAAFSVAEPGFLTVAFADSRPRVYGDSESIKGPYGYLVDEFAERNGLEVKPFKTDFSGALLAVQQGRADMGYAAYYSDDRAKVVRFVHQDIYDVSFYMVKDDGSISDWTDIERIATVDGFVQNPHFVEALGRDNVLTFTGYADGVQALKNGQVDAYYVTNFGLGLLENEPDLTLIEMGDGDFAIPMDTRTPQGPYVRCGNDDLHSAYNAFYEDVHDSEEYQKVWTDAFASSPIEDPLGLIPPVSESPKNQC